MSGRPGPGGAGRPPIPPGGRIIDKTVEIPCYVCERAKLQVPEALARKLKGLIRPVCPKCDQEAKMFLYSLYKRSRAEFQKNQPPGGEVPSDQEQRSTPT